MRLDFNVLWVDDQPDRVAAQITAIAKRMEQEGFQFSPTLCVSMDKVRSAISSDVFTDEVDLILVDWDLGNNVEGQDAIAEIRERVQYKDVVFYSAHTLPEDLRRAAFNRGLEGVYCASREQLVEEVMGVFESLVKKVLDLDHTRGIVMGATSDIDNIVNECLIAVHRRLDGDGQAKMLSEALTYVQARLKDIAKKAKELEGATTLTEFFDAHMIFTANDRLRFLGGILKGHAYSAQKGYRPAILTYQQRVVPSRNRLGHMILVPKGKPRTVADSGADSMTLDETRELRRIILDLRLQFRSLLEAILSIEASGGNSAIRRK